MLIVLVERKKGFVVIDKEVNRNSKLRLMCKVRKLFVNEDEDEENSNLYRGSHLAVLYLRSTL